MQLRPDEATVARQAAERFLDRYVAADGQVHRYDQGGDTVSEGQAYALLLAQVADRPETVRRVWSWTRQHMRRADGLLPYHASPDEVVLDEQAATDADLLAAWALLRTSGPADDDLRKEGRRLADAVLAKTLVRTDDGLALLVAGPWAAQPARRVINVSYWAPAVYADLARRTGDLRWQELGDAVTPLLGRVTDNGQQLPPNWAVLVADDLVPVAGPDADPDESAGTPAYGLDAQRTLVWAATSCQPVLRQLGATWGERLAGVQQQAAVSLDLQGRVLLRDQHPLGLVAAAAAAAADGRDQERNALLNRAAQLEEQHPSYYGSAWVALGRALLTTDTLDAC